MKKSLIMLTALLVATAAVLAATRHEAQAQEEAVKVRMSFNNQEVIIEMFDNPASRDFLSMLPYTGQFEDYAGAEKISYLPRKLALPGSGSARQTQGDFTYYSPWGNLAVFYDGYGFDGSLYILGRIVSGKEKLAAMKEGFTATIEKAE